MDKRDGAKNTDDTDRDPEDIHHGVSPVFLLPSHPVSVFCSPVALYSARREAEAGSI